VDIPMHNLLGVKECNTTSNISSNTEPPRPRKRA
jgi:hypothetical protein